jgi:hypothetical protein
LESITIATCVTLIGHHIDEKILTLIGHHIDEKILTLIGHHIDEKILTLIGPHIAEKILTRPLTSRGLSGMFFNVAGRFVDYLL